jgi:hypothetical protein
LKRAIPSRSSQLGFATHDGYHERAKPSAQLAQVGATERTNSNSVTAFGQFPMRATLARQTVSGCRYLRGGSPAELTPDTPSLCTSGLAGRAADVIISMTLFAPVRRGLRVRSNLLRDVGSLHFLGGPKVLGSISPTHVNASRQLQLRESEPRCSCQARRRPGRGGVGFRS